MTHTSAALNGALKAAYATRKRAAVVTRLRGDERVKAMAKSPAYSAPVMTTPPVITRATAAAAAATASVAYNSPALRWSGPVIDTTYSYQPRHFTRVDGTTSAAPDTTIAFDYDARYLSLSLSQSTTLNYRVWVNEQAHAAAMQPAPGGTTGGAWLNIDFGSTSYGLPRRIVIELEDTATPIQLFGMSVEPTASVLPPTISSPRVILVGDSYGAGIGGNFQSESYAITLGRLMGWADCWSAGTSVPSTGLVATNGTNIGAYGSRLTPDVVPYAPDAVIIQGSLNDSSAGANTIGPAFTSYVNNLRQALPDCLVVATSPLITGTPSASDLSNRDQLKSAANTLGVPFVDLFSPVQIFTGTGKAGATTGSGNADVYRAPDGTHPTKEGHYVLAHVISAQLTAKIGLG